MSLKPSRHSIQIFKHDEHVIFQYLVEINTKVLKEVHLQEDTCDLIVMGSDCDKFQVSADSTIPRLRRLLIATTSGTVEGPLELQRSIAIGSWKAKTLESCWSLREVPLIFTSSEWKNEPNNQLYDFLEPFLFKPEIYFFWKKKKIYSFQCSTFSFPLLFIPLKFYINFYEINKVVLVRFIAGNRFSCRRWDTNCLPQVSVPLKAILVSRNLIKKHARYGNAWSFSFPCHSLFPSRFIYQKTNSSRVQSVD